MDRATAPDGPVSGGRAPTSGRGLSSFVIRLFARMKLKCPKCSAEIDIGPNNDSDSDISWKVRCPVIEQRLQIIGGSGEKLICLDMVKVRDAAIQKHSRDQG
jgi:hypothetical protein